MSDSGIGKGKTFIYKTVQDSKQQKVEIPLDIYFPKTSHSSPAKPLIWIHTGGFLQGTRKFYPLHFLRACDRLNLALIAPDYRLAPQVKIQDVLDDVRDSIKFVLGNKEENTLNGQLKQNDLPVLDTSQYILAGSSAGGWAALLQGLGLIDHSLPSPLALIAIYPITTVNKDRAPYFYEPLKPLPWAYSLQAKVGDEIPIEPLQPHLDENTAILTEAPPLVLTSRAPLYSYSRQEGIYADLILAKGQDPNLFCLPSLIEGNDWNSNKTKLVYLAYGDTDPMVEIDQSKQVIKALQSSKVPFQVGTYVEPGKGHLWDILDTEADIPDLWEKIEKLLSY